MLLKANSIASLLKGQIQKVNILAEDFDLTFVHAVKNINRLGELLLEGKGKDRELLKIYWEGLENTEKDILLSDEGLLLYLEIKQAKTLMELLNFVVQIKS